MSEARWSDHKEDFGVVRVEDPPSRPHFEGLDAPLDRWLRHIFEADMWSTPKTFKLRMEELVIAQLQNKRSALN